MATPASTLVSDDPYATATRLLQAGANLNLHQAGELLSKQPYAAVTGLACMAQSDMTAVEVVDWLVGQPCQRLDALQLHDLVDAVYETDPGRWDR